jgi:hypothetical protein
MTAPAGVTVVEGSGRTLLPGLIDAHTHSWGSARRDALRFGVTTELDMFSDWHQIAAARRERESLAPTAIADLWSAGTLATVPHGHGTEYGMPIPTLTTPAEAPAFVAARFAEGSDYLKIILEDGSAYGQHLPTLDAATVQALVAAAHADHKMAMAHVATEHDAQVAVDAGIDGLAHVFLDRSASPAFIASARAHRVFVVATLADRGRIAPGLRADLVLVDGDPTQDITATRAIVAIWKNGALVDRSLLPDERVVAADAAPSADSLISDFDDGAISVRFGQNWIVSTDQLAGGKSTATIGWEAGGADGSKGALRVRGEIDGGLPYAWAGTLFMPGAKPFEAVDFSQRTTLSFKVRGDARPLSAMLFSGGVNQRMPAVTTFQATPEWTEVRLPLKGFGGADLTQLRGVAFTAGLPAGPFTFEIDDIRIE